MHWMIILFGLLWPSFLWAECGGRDLRDTLTEAQRTEIDTRLAGQPYQSGNHWKATRGDRTLFLIGTMHVDDPRVDALTARLAPEVRSADLLMLEADKEAEKSLARELASNPSLVFLTGKTLIDLLPPDDWAALSAAAQARGIPGFMAAKMRPWYLSMMLAMSPCDTRSLRQGKRGLDARLTEIAEAADVPTASLEDPKAVLSLFNQDPLEEQIDLLMLGILPVQYAEDAAFTLKEHFFEEETLHAWELSRVVTRELFDMPAAEFDRLFDEFSDLLLRQRNEAWIAPIEAANGDVIVVAAGALHMAGPYGLPNLLEGRGYALERLPF